MIHTIAPFKLRIAVRRGFTQWHRSELPEELIVFTVERNGSAEAVVACEIREINVPLTYEAARDLDVSTFSLPPYVSAALREAIPPNAELWVEFDEPPGYLPMLPWEAVLFEAGGFAALRMAPGEVAPVMTPGDLDAILCFSSPLSMRSKDAAAKRLVDFFFDLVPKTDRQVRVHVFADAQTRPLLKERMARALPSFTIKIYEPSPKAAYIERFEPPEKGSRKTGRARASGARDNPWLAWMRTALKRYSVEYVHFVCDGQLAQCSGGLAFAAPIITDDPRWARIVSARELNHFLTDIGAWSVAFSAPSDASIGGLRYLVHDLSRLRTGPLFLHDMKADRKRNSLERAYTYTLDTTTFSGSPALTVYWNPSRSVYNEDHREMLENLTIADVVQRRPEASGGLVRLQRSLEASAVRLTAEPTTSLAAAIRTGRERGLDFASDVIKRHLGDDDSVSKSSR